MHVYQGFSVPVFEDFPGDEFPTLARGTAILLSFLQFRTLLDPHFPPAFSPLFRARCICGRF
jgi:hypothetical protein